MASVQHQPLRLNRYLLAGLSLCPRRFWLQAKAQLSWPAAPASQAALEAAQMGRAFHQLMQRYYLGLEVGAIPPDLNQLWRTWQRHLLAFPPGRFLPELALTVPIVVADAELAVRFDLVQVPSSPGGKLLIVDWKTGRRRRDAGELAIDSQSRLYRYVLVEGAPAILSGRRVEPEDVAMIFWQASNPANPVKLAYSAALHQENKTWLEGLASQARAIMTSEMPPLLDDLAICVRCPFATFCDRPPAPGDELDPIELEPSGDESDPLTPQP